MPTHPDPEKLRTEAECHANFMRLVRERKNARSEDTIERLDEQIEATLDRALKLEPRLGACS